MISVMIAAPASGSGKTAVTCGMLALFKRMGKTVCAFKCGPDYIDPMFHRNVLGVESHNLDLFLSREDDVKAQYERYRAGYDAVVCEGVMGYYDGVGGTTAQASAWHLADTLDMPVILVIRPKGASLTLAAQIKGLCSLREPHHIAGVIFNDCTPMMFGTIADTVERESGVPVLGYLPHMEEAEFESRHLGLFTAAEIDDLSNRIERIALQLENSLDTKRLFRILERECGNAADGSSMMRNVNAPAPLDELNEGGSAGRVPIAVARDEAFCFAYEESIDAIRAAGGEPVYFSPVRDGGLPEDAAGLYLPGGYPELYARELSENKDMLTAVKTAAENGMPVVAECGGFLYLGKSLEGSDGKIYSMAGVLPGEAERKARLVRFGYAMLTAKEDSMLFRAGETIHVHEFHYWDSTCNGTAFEAAKPVSGRSWECGFAGDSMYAGFPHLYFAGNTVLAGRFVKAAADYRNGRRKTVQYAKKGEAGTGGVSE